MARRGASLSDALRRDVRCEPAAAGSLHYQIRKAPSASHRADGQARHSASMAGTALDGEQLGTFNRRGRQPSGITLR